MSDKRIRINSKEYNVYATIEEADEYFAPVFNSGWDLISPFDKEKLLITATLQIDKKDYQGELVDENQPLKFPRIINEEETSEKLLIQACSELANKIYSNNGITTNISNLKSVSLGDSSLTFNADGYTENDVDLLIEEYLSYYLSGGVRVLL